MSVRVLKVTSCVSTPSQLEERFKLWKECIAQAMKEKCKEEICLLLACYIHCTFSCRKQVISMCMCMCTCDLQCIHKQCTCIIITIM